MTIKHIVLSGGGPIMITLLSILQELEKSAFFSMDNIETIYGTSAGAIVAVMLSLQFEWETLNNYVLKRPWQDVFVINVQTILDSYGNCGLFSVKTIEKCFKPLFDTKDIPLNITMKEFCDKTKIELHFCSFELNTYQLYDISPKTFPNLPVFTALQMTCALPLLISPVFLGEQCFMDGGVACNYPIRYCIESGNPQEEIMGIKNEYINQSSTMITDKSTLFDYLLSFVFKAICSIQMQFDEAKEEKHGYYEVVCKSNYLTMEELKQSIVCAKKRFELFEQGKETAANFLKQETHLQ